jgi:hypothetical protein
MNNPAAGGRKAASAQTAEPKETRDAAGHTAGGAPSRGGTDHAAAGGRAAAKPKPLKNLRQRKRPSL